MAMRRVRAPFVGKGSALTRVNRLAHVLDRMMEKKAVDYTFSSGAGGVPDTGILFEATSLAQGDTRSTRSGNVVSPVALYLKGFVTASTTDGRNTVRVLVFRWNDTTAPLVSDVIESSFGDWSIAPYNWANSGTKLQILYDKVSVSDAASDTWRVDTSVRIPFKPTDQVRYSGPAANEGVSGRIWFLMFSDSGAVPHPTCLYSSRLVYRDA